MKVLQVYKDYYPPVKGGIEGHMNILSRGLQQKGVAVEVLVSNTRPRLDVEIIEGIKVIKAPQIGRFASAPLNATFFYWIRKLGRDADLLHFHFPNPTGEISYLFSGLTKPVIVSYHSDIIRQKRLEKVYRPFLHRFLCKAHTIIVGSPNYLHTSKVLEKYQHKCTIVPYGIDIDSFGSESKIRETAADLKRIYTPPIILFVGVFRYYKGLHVLIEAMQKVDARLLLVGSGPLDAEIRDHITQKGLNKKIRLLGELTQNGLTSHLHACDLFVLPSIMRSESFGIAQLEAMAMKKAVICTELGTGTSFVNQHEKTGLVVPPNDADTLAKAINHLLVRPDLRAKYGETGRKRVEALFSKEQMIETIIPVYEHALAGRAPKRIAAVSAPVAGKTLDKKIRVLRIISRLNIGGPAIHVHVLTQGLDPQKFDSILLTGTISPYEGDMSYLFASKGKKPLMIPGLQREISLGLDLKAALYIFKMIKKMKPDIVHTHTAKAGGSARLAVLFYNLISLKHIKMVHTFHGHVFHGYFSKVRSRMVVWFERFIGRLTDVFIAISESQEKALANEFRIAPAQKIRTIKLGFNLDPFLNCKNSRGNFRRKMQIGSDVKLIGIIGRLAPIKNHAMFLEAARCLVSANMAFPMKFVVVGDGELREKLEFQTFQYGLCSHVLFCGWQKKIIDVYADLDIVALTSLNEGTPVSIIEAMAAAVPVICTDVGGVRDLLGKACNGLSASEDFRICERGVLCKPNDAVGFAKGLAYMLQNGFGRNEADISRTRDFIIRNHSSQRLIREIEALYSGLCHP